MRGDGKGGQNQFGHVVGLNKKGKSIIIFAHNYFFFLMPFVLFFSNAICLTWLVKVMEFQIFYSLYCIV